jgi:Spx/MgsR family transcriptional regulator
MITLFGIKNCDTVKKARLWLDAKSINYRFHDFRADGINAEQIICWLQSIGIETLINKRSTTWKMLSDSDKASLNESTVIPLLIDKPTLIKRPLLALEADTYVGFKADKYAAIFKDN